MFSLGASKGTGDRSKRAAGGQRAAGQMLEILQGPIWAVAAVRKADSGHF